MFGLFFLVWCWGVVVFALCETNGSNVRVVKMLVLGWFGFWFGLGLGFVFLIVVYFFGVCFIVCFVRGLWVYLC